MGLESVKAVSEDPELELVAQTDLDDNLSETIKHTNAQVVIDFTTAAVVMKNATEIIKSGVIGSPGRSAS
jgi:dihydrodipicolinate reductase